MDNESDTRKPTQEEKELALKSLVELANTIDEADGYLNSYSPYDTTEKKIKYLEDTFKVFVVAREDDFGDDFWDDIGGDFCGVFEEDLDDEIKKKRREESDYCAMLNTVINSKWR